MTEFMQGLEQEFLKATGLKNRQFYKIFYSRIDTSPLLILGINPGGRVDENYLSASASYYENWEHDYVDFQNDTQYRIASPMCDFLFTTLNTQNRDILRRIPVTNTIFRRSPNTKALKITQKEAIEETKPFLEKIIRKVNPKVILFTGKGAYDNFKLNYLNLAQIKLHFMIW